MTATIQKLGDGLALLLPPTISATAGLAENVQVEVSMENGAVVVRPLGVKRYTLDELLEGMTPENLHGETDWGPDVGREVVE